MQALKQVNLNRLVVFVAVVEAGSFTAAARALSMTKTMVSAHIQRLEAELGTSLLVRTTRRIHLTQAGEAFFHASQRIVQDTQEAITAASESSSEPRGILRVTAPVDYGSMVVSRVAAMLAVSHPALKIELVTRDDTVDLAGERFDVGIRLGRLAESSYRATRLSAFAFWPVASPQFLATRGAPVTLEELKALPLIALSVLPRPTRWEFEGPQQQKIPLEFSAGLSVNTALSAHQAALAGGGFAILPDFIVADDIAAGRLAHLLPQWKLHTGGIYAVVPASRQRSRKVRIFIEAMRRHIELDGR